MPIDIERPSVMLLHETPGGGSHIDWMIQLDSGALMTFRVDQRPDIEPGITPNVEMIGFDATRLADHREIYLRFEGELAGGRGRVSRVAAGVARFIECGAARIVIEGCYSDSHGAGDAPHGTPRKYRWIGTLVEGDRWRFQMQRPGAC